MVMFTFFLQLLCTAEETLGWQNEYVCIVLINKGQVTGRWLSLIFRLQRITPLIHNIESK